MAATRSVFFFAVPFALVWAVATSSQASDQPQTQGMHIETDGMLTKREARRFSRVASDRRKQDGAASDSASFWVFDYLSRMLDGDPVAQRPRRMARPAVAQQPRRVAAAPTAVNPVTTGSITPLATPLAVATSALQPGIQKPATPMTAEIMESVVVAAERSQARLDLIKLELAARTYDERKLSGQLVFEQRGDWRVLERSRDALSGPELTSALAAGFEANVYINDETRTIVVAVAGSQDLRRDFIGADIWKALIKAEAPQQFYLAKTYARSVIQRYQMQGYATECVGHSLGGGACAYAAAELGIRALVLNPISAGKLPNAARFLVTNYIVDGEIANLVYSARGNETSGQIQKINDGRDVIRLMALEKYGQLAGPMLVVRELGAGVVSHKVDKALDLVAVQAETVRPR